MDNNVMRAALEKFLKLGEQAREYMLGNLHGRCDEKLSAKEA